MNEQDLCGLLQLCNVLVIIRNIELCNALITKASKSK